jgi:hypothetical protein
MIKAKYYIILYILYFYSIIVQQYLHDTLNLSQPLDFFFGVMLGSNTLFEKKSADYRH